MCSFFVITSGTARSTTRPWGHPRVSIPPFSYSVILGNPIAPTEYIGDGWETLEKRGGIRSTGLTLARRFVGQRAGRGTGNDAGTRSAAARPLRVRDPRAPGTASESHDCAPLRQAARTG